MKSCFGLVLLFCLFASAQTQQSYLTEAVISNFVTFSPITNQYIAGTDAKESSPAEFDPEGNWGQATEGFQLSIRLKKKLFTNGELTFVETEVIDTFSVGVRDMDGFTNGAPNRDLTFTVWCMNGPTLVDVPAKPEFAYKAELLDANGVAVQKTEFGKKVGKKFADFDEAASEKNVKLERIPALKKGDLAAWMVLFRPSDLFEIQRPGNYKLRLWLQILTYPRVGPNRGEWLTRLVRFPPLDYPLVQTKLIPKSP